MSPSRILRSLIACLLIIQTPLCFGAEPQWQSLLPHIDLKQDTVAGEWQIAGQELQVGAAAGARLMLPVAPQGEYDLEVSFTRKTGVHSVALIFSHGGKQATFEVDAWGGHLAGLQQIGGQDVRQNPTRSTHQLENGQRYTMTVEVRSDSVRGLLDGKQIAIHRTTGADLSLLDVWRLPQANRLGIGVWDSAATIHQLRVRPLEGAPLQMARANPERTQPAPSTRPMVPTPTPAPAQPVTRTVNGKRALIVIANQDFFYREYADPRAELERAGIRVTVAAGRKAVCRPHDGSGQGADGGLVTPDLALSDVKAADFDAILFSGGWGASMYQFAFTGRYDNPIYNGDPQTKSQVNRVINEFLSAGKPTCALCNAVSVLAWARVDGRSPLQGKLVCAPTRAAPSGVYNGQRAQPSCRWHPETNGARMSPAGSIGRPGTAEDDVAIDGLIITGEDDISAREMGRRIVQVLAQK